MAPAIIVKLNDMETPGGKKRVYWRKINPASLDPEKGLAEYIYTPDEFAEIIEREKALSVRNGHKVCLVVFRFDPLRFTSPMVRDLLVLLASRIRLTDEVGWYGKDAIGVILHQTPASGAAKFVEWVRRLFNDLREEVQELNPPSVT